MVAEIAGYEPDLEAPVRRPIVAVRRPRRPKFALDVLAVPTVFGEELVGVDRWIVTHEKQYVRVAELIIAGNGIGLNTE